jgi:hypothetical protein
MKKKTCPNPITKETVKDTLSVLKKAGFSPKLVGSVATKGCSIHDVDVRIWLPDGAYETYHDILKQVGWELRASADDHMEHNLESWKREGVILDVWIDE